MYTDRQMYGCMVDEWLEKFRFPPPRLCLNAEYHFPPTLSCDGGGKNDV